ncbi:MAG: hypothetical protein AABW46_01485 [Nanoarchaeota archaeon]
MWGDKKGLKALNLLLLLGGVYYIFKGFSSGVTGAVVGAENSNNIVLGVVLFLIALAVSHFFMKE